MRFATDVNRLQRRILARFGTFMSDYIPSRLRAAATETVRISTLIWKTEVAIPSLIWAPVYASFPCKVLGHCPRLTQAEWRKIKLWKITKLPRYYRRNL